MPSPQPSANGMSPSTVLEAVIRIGRSLSAQRRAMSAPPRPFSRRLRYAPTSLPRNPPSTGWTRAAPGRLLDGMATSTAARRDTYVSPTVIPATPEEPHDSDQVRVQVTWDDWRTALVRPGDLDDVHWRSTPGAPRPLIHAYVACTRVAAGELPHDCEPTSRPHRLLVCVLKCHVSSRVFAYLLQQAGTCGSEATVPKP